jgi:hypothetical protein
MLDTCRVAVTISVVQFAIRTSLAEEPLPIGQFRAFIPDSLRKMVWNGDCCSTRKSITKMSEWRIRL